MLKKKRDRNGVVLNDTVPLLPFPPEPATEGKALFLNQSLTYHLFYEVLQSSPDFKNKIQLRPCQIRSLPL